MIHASKSPTRTLAAIAALVALAECGGKTTSDPNTTSTHDGSSLPTEITLAPGTYADVIGANLRVIFDNVVSDSRCPTSVACIWAGSATIQLTTSRISNDRNLTPVTLATEAGKDTITVYGQALKLVRVVPILTTTDPQPQSSYRVTLRVGTSK